MYDVSLWKYVFFLCVINPPNLQGGTKKNFWPGVGFFIKTLDTEPTNLHNHAHD